VSEIVVSAVLAVDVYATGERTVAALGRQTVADRLELVLVGPRVVVPPGASDGLAAVVTVDAPLRPLSAARAAGIAAARGRVVFVAETHGFPRPDCLERLVEAVDAGASAVMPRVVNANAGTARSWASLFATYGAYTGSTASSLDAVALHNGAFVRDILADVAARPDDLVYGVGLTDDLRSRGSSMQFVPAAVVDHLNVVSPRGIVVDRFVGGRLWAGMRARRWSARRRVAHVLGAPLAPLVMLARILGSDGWRELRGATPRGTALALGAWSVMQTCGEVAGYALGPGAAEDHHVELELHREAFL
jgi:hypothetical protein